MITHIGTLMRLNLFTDHSDFACFKVLVKFIPDATEAQKQLWRDEVKNTLGKIPQVIEVRVGRKVVIPASASLDGGWDDG